VSFSKKEKVFLVFIGFLIVVDFFVWKEVFDLERGGLEVVFFDVGQGDAIFIETPQNHQILIDGGDGDNILKKLQQEMPFWDRSLDLVILTHPEKDHIGGLVEVLERYEVDYILWNGVIRDIAEYKKWQKLVEKKKAKEVIAEKRKVAKAGRVEINILYPFLSFENEEFFETSNDTSIVSKLKFGSACFLFTGDITKTIERKLVNEEVDLNCEILKVAHHGSKYSSSYEFLNEVTPEVAVVQVGDNSYGHPSKEALQRLDKFGKVLRTDLNGDIEIFSDGSYYNFKFKN